MDKNALKKYAIWARNELIEKVTQKAQQYGIEEGKDTDLKLESINGMLLSENERKQRQALIHRVKENGYSQVLEEVAYTWFNRFIALRFMEVNGYLPSHIRVFTDETGNFRPQILSEALHLELDGLDMEKVYELKNDNREEELFKYLLITQCNALSDILPNVFQKIADYTELLLPDHLLREGSVIEQMVNPQNGISEMDWKEQVQIIGWLYQYYNTEPKDKVFADLKKNSKITKETIPAATQLFTPDWIVRYMVENSLGKMWLEGHGHNKNDFLPLDFEMKKYAQFKDDEGKWYYYLDEIQQEEIVEKELEVIRKDYSKMQPEEIRCIDPCMGSGHVLCCLFDVLIKIYESYGFSSKDAASLIIEKNIYGLDIDDRAAQLAYFAIMMKARQYDRRFFSRNIQPHVYSVQESKGITSDIISAFAGENKRVEDDINYLLGTFENAKEYGSIIEIDEIDYDSIFLRFNELEKKEHVNLFEMEAREKLYPLVQVAQTMSQKYHIVVTNPPYMGSSGMSKTLLKYIEKHYGKGKTDLFAIMMSHWIKKLYPNGFMSMVTMQSWMFLSTFKKLREKILEKDLISLARIGYNSFPEMNSQVAHACMFTVRNSSCNKYGGVFLDLNTGKVTDDKDLVFLNRKISKEWYVRNRDDFEHIPSNELAFSLPDKVINAFNEQPSLNDVGTTRLGMTTADNNRFTRMWYEVDINRCILNAKSEQEVIEHGKKWVPYNKGGKYRKWYGNLDVVVNWENSGYEIKNFADDKGHIRSTVPNTEYYFKECATWSKISTDTIAFRYRPAGSIFDVAGACLFADQGLHELLAFCNSKVAINILNRLSPTLNFEGSQIASLPIIKEMFSNEEIRRITEENISIVKKDWDANETSWDYCKHPFLEVKKAGDSLSATYNMWQKYQEDMFAKLKMNEERLNSIFISMYGLSDDLTPEVPEKEVSVSRPDKGRDVKSFISYAVGCMFGRYSLDENGLVYAGGAWNSSQYHTFIPDIDNIIPICDDEYFSDDIVGMFINFVEIVFGKEALEDNLQFIAEGLGGKGSSREVIRSYFINNFYSDHVKMYQKKPIYWLFDSGKNNGFKCLIYMHRYQPDTIARIRTDYVHEQQARYRTSIEEISNRVDSATGSDKVKLTKKLNTLKAQNDEIHVYEEKIHHLADQMISIDLDDGVKKNYEIFKDVLAKIK